MDAMNLLGLTCAVVAALAFGVLLGYSACQALFALLKAHARSLSAGAAQVKAAAEGQAAQIQTAG